MRKLKVFLLLFASAFIVGSLSAQTQAKVALSWSASPSSTTATPGTTNVYRASGNCPTVAPTTTAGFSLIATSIAPTGPYTDTVQLTANAQTMCYFVTAVIGGLESVPSTTFQASIEALPAQKPQPPTKLTGTVTYQ